MQWLALSPQIVGVAWLEHPDAFELVIQALGLQVLALYVRAHRHPNVLDLRSFHQELLALALLCTQPIPAETSVYKCSLHVARRDLLDVRTADSTTKVSHGVYVLVLDQSLGHVVSVACHNVDHTSWQIGRIEHLIEIGGCERVVLRRDRNYRVATDHCWCNEGNKP